MEMSRRVEINNRNGYDVFLDGLDSSAVHHCEVVYMDLHRESILGRFHTYNGAADFVAEQAWFRKDNGRYSLVDPKLVKMYAVIDWVPEVANVYKTQGVVAVPEASEPKRPLVLRPAFI